MKILIPICDGGYPIRGVVYYIKGCLEALREIDTENEYIIIVDRHQTLFKHLKGKNFKVIQVNAPDGRVAIHKWYIDHFPKIAEKYNPDIIHYVNNYLISKKLKNVAFTIHDLAEFDQPEKHGVFKSFVRRRILKQNVKRAKHIMTVSEYTKNQIVSILNVKPSNIVVASNGVDISKFKHTVKCEMPNDDKGRDIPKEYFLYVGAIERTKNINTLIKAIAKLNNENFNANLVLVGGFGDAFHKVKVLTKKLSLDENIYFTGYLDEESLIKVYQNAVGLVHPSLIEGFGMIIVQAMASKIPVIASNATALPEVVGDAGILINPRSIDEMVDAMKSISTDNQLRKELIHKGSARAKMFSWEDTAYKILEVYKKFNK